MAILSNLGADDAQIASSMAEIRAVPGRFDVFYGRGLTVIVDYAHTPEGIERLLRDVSALRGEGRIITVLGAGGDRDRVKRPAMGHAASAASDLTIVTSDNPRFEAPDAIIDAVMSGVVAGASVLREVDRRVAISRAFEHARRGDVVVVAGKGHESTQSISGVELPFDDRAVVQELLK
jgi:UDP-N-acetylmuramoyl-L-alanyl-D-glutamate--2,6-diaminopimelate ligase